MRILILAPHQDDEILSAGLLMQTSISRGDEVYVVFATNGDYHGRKIAAQRYQESITALNLLGIEESHILYMGYGDTGMRYDHSFLYRLFQHGECDVLPTPCSDQTYHPAGGETFHHAHTAQEAPYCHNCFLEDLNGLLDICHIDTVVLPSCLDHHGDHAGCFLFMEKVCRMRGNAPILLTYLLHAGDDTLWPNRSGVQFHRPQIISPQQWEGRLTIHASITEAQVKRSCICCFQSQNIGGNDNYLLSFAKREENFFPIGGVHPIMNIFP